MIDLERIIRTLIVCFVIVIFGMIPLRFIEIENQRVDVKVLGESVVLPDAEVNTNQLEPPYDVIDAI